MADNISALDAALAIITLAAKEIAGVKYPRSILTAPDGSDLTPLTDAQLRAAAVPVSGPLTDGQLRASAVPISAAVLPLPSGAATQATLATLLTAAQAIQSAAEALNTKTNTTTAAHFAPGFDLAAGPGAGGNLQTDPEGHLATRGQVLTDELGYRCNFANSSLAVGIGTATFTNGSAVVTGSGLLAADVRKGDYVKLNADAEAAWVQVGDLVSDTEIALAGNYTGTGGTGASSRAIVRPVTGPGGSIAVAGGVCTLTAGTTTGSITEIERDVDWLPLVKQAGVTVSQRIANQSIFVGFYDEVHPSAPYWFAWFLLDGTTNTTVKCQSARNPSGAPSVAETEETTVSLPNGATSAASRRYRVEVLGDRVNFLVDGILVATHFKAMPGPGDLLTSTVRVLNGTTPASSTTVTVDYDTVKNHNKLEMGLLSDAEQVMAAQPAAQMFSYSAGAVVIPINTDLLVIDCSQFRSISILAGSVGTTGVVTAAWSNDGATDWITATLLSEAGVASTTFTGASAQLRTTPVRARYLRLRMTTATTAAGATRINVAGFQSDISVPLSVATQPVSGTVTATVTGATQLPVTPTQTFTNSAASTNATSTKSSAGTLWAVQASNINAAARYLKLYNKASAPTVGTDVPALTIPLPAGQVVQIDGGSNGIRFGTGIAWALTVSAADSATDAVAASEIKVALAYT